MVTKRNKSKSSVKAKRWPASKLEFRPLSKLKLYERNARVHSAEQITLIAKSMVDNGWTTPILIDERNVVIAGHGKAAAAKQLVDTDGRFGRVPVIVARGWSASQKNAYRIQDNSLALMSTWDLELLRAEMVELKTSDVDLGILGFSLDDLALYTADEPTGADPEEVPYPPKKPVSRLGDMWIMAGHKLLCGDSTKPEDVTKVLGKDKPHLCVTDQPYGVDYDPDWRNRSDRANGKPYGAGAVGLVHNDSRSDWREAYSLFPGDVTYAWHAGLRAKHTFVALEASGFEIRAQIIWAKSNIVIGRGHYHFQHEPCFFAVRKGRTAHWSGDRKQTTLWAIDKPQKSETGHSTQKPIECMKRPIENNSKRGDYVYDPFVGSGTTIAAAELTGRKALCLEIAPEYCDVSILRWQLISGKDAVLAATGQTFFEVAAERTKKRPPKKGAKKSKPREAKAVRLSRSRSTGSTPRASSPSAT